MHEEIVRLIIESRGKLGVEEINTPAGPNTMSESSRRRHFKQLELSPKYEDFCLEQNIPLHHIVVHCHKD